MRLAPVHVILTLRWPCQVVAYPWEKLSDLRQAIYPEGFYNVRGPSALHQAIWVWVLGVRPAS